MRPGGRYGSELTRPHQFSDQGLGLHPKDLGRLRTGQTIGTELFNPKSKRELLLTRRERTMTNRSA